MNEQSYRGWPWRVFAILLALIGLAIFGEWPVIWVWVPWHATP